MICNRVFGVNPELEAIDIKTPVEMIDAQILRDLRFQHPILVRDCPGEPARIIFREDGEIGGGGKACRWLEDECIFFEPQ